MIIGVKKLGYSKYKIHHNELFEIVISDQMSRIIPVTNREIFRLETLKIEVLRGAPRINI